MSEDDVPDVFEDALGSKPATPSDMRRVTNFINRHAELCDRRDRLAEEINSIKQEIWSIEYRDLPSLMSEIGQKQAGTEKGYVEVVTDVEAKLPSADPARRAAALKWLKENKHDGLIKSLLTVAVGRGDLEEAEELAKKINRESNKFRAVVAEDIHHSTYTAFARREVRAGKPLPMELLGIKAVTKAEIKKPKES